MTALPYVSALLSSRATLHTGVSRSGGAVRWVLVSRGLHTAPRVLAMGGSLAAHPVKIGPIEAHVDLGMRPVHYVCDELSGEDADRWIARNELRIFPAGMPADQIAGACGVDGGLICHASIGKQSLLDAMSSQSIDRVCPVSQSVPLWDLARLYAPLVGQPCVIWRTGEEGSILGYVQDGVLRSLCHFWAGTGDLARPAADVQASVVSLIRSLTGGRSDLPVIVLGGDPASSALPNIGSLALQHPPSIDGVPMQYHEAYALALHEETYLDFADPETTRAYRASTRARAAVLRVVRTMGWSLLCALGLLVLVQGGLRVAESQLGKSAEPVLASARALESLGARRDSLVAQYAVVARASSKESAVTALLDQMQRVFPEGVWLDILSIGEQDAGTWSVDMNGFALSTSSIPVFLQNLKSVSGMSGVHMQYSEQTFTNVRGRKERVVGFKVAGSWTPSSAGGSFAESATAPRGAASIEPTNGQHSDVSGQKASTSP